MIIIKKLHFDDFEDFACAVADTYDEVKYDDECNSVDIIAKYDDAKEIICELIAIGYGIAFIDEFGDTECNAYDDAFVISLLEDEIWCEPIKRENEYLLVETEVAYILDNCSSKIISNIESDVVYEVEVGNGDNDCDECECTCKKDEKPNPTVSTSSTKSTYKINNKEVSKEEFDKKYNEFEEMYLDNIRDMLLRYCDFIDEVNDWRSKFLRW